jgi:murein DD-endopeptidase MepM/ murein hydrolase activator NlpD
MKKTVFVVLPMLLYTLSAFGVARIFTLNGDHSAGNRLEIGSIPDGSRVRIKYIDGYFTGWDLDDPRPWWGAYAGDCVSIISAGGSKKTPFNDPSTTGYFSLLSDLTNALHNLPAYEFTQTGGDSITAFVWSDSGARADTLTQRDGELRFSVEIIPEATYLPNYTYAGENGPQTLTDIQIDHGRFNFTFATVETGRCCLVSWSTNMMDWFPLLNFDAATEGTLVSDTVTFDNKAYSACYMPLGFEFADQFDYPIGDEEMRAGTVPEQIASNEPNEQNELYPEAEANVSEDEDKIERPTESQIRDFSMWYNFQDVGSYNDDISIPGYHPGEDWNFGGSTGGIGDDVGSNVYAVANGVVEDIRPLQNSSLESGGWALVIRHYLLEWNDTPNPSVDSVYVHIAPPFKADGITTNFSGELGAQSWFPFEKGSYVPKGTVIGVIGDVLPPNSGGFPDHLHFELRTKLIIISEPELAASANYWPLSRRRLNGSYTTYYDSFSDMEDDGIIDPSDYIDDH